jgi:hypothetical protein
LLNSKKESFLNKICGFCSTTCFITAQTNDLFPTHFETQRRSMIFQPKLVDLSKSMKIPSKQTDFSFPKTLKFAKKRIANQFKRTILPLI